MSRRLHWFNLFGVFALSALCVTQWRANRRLNLELNDREQVRLEQSARLEEHAQAASAQNGDLASLRAHLARVSDELKLTAGKLAEAERELDRLKAERDQLKSSVTNWAGALAARDDRLRQSASQIRTLAEERNELARKHNDLAALYNKQTREWTELEARLAEALKAARPTNR